MEIPIRTARTPWLFRMILRTGKFCVKEEGLSTDGAKKKTWLLKTLMKANLSSFTSLASSGSR